MYCELRCQVRVVSLHTEVPEETRQESEVLLVADLVALDLAARRVLELADAVEAGRRRCHPRTQADCCGVSVSSVAAYWSGGRSSCSVRRSNRLREVGHVLLEYRDRQQAAFREVPLDDRSRFFARNGESCGLPSVTEARSSNRCRRRETADGRREVLSCGRAITLAQPPRKRMVSVS